MTSTALIFALSATIGLTNLVLMNLFGYFFGIFKKYYPFRVLHILYLLVLFFMLLILCEWKNLFLAILFFGLTFIYILLSMKYIYVVVQNMKALSFRDAKSFYNLYVFALGLTTFAFLFVLAFFVWMIDGSIVL